MFKSEPFANGEHMSFILIIIFTLVARLNTKLESQNYPPMTSLVKDLSDGVRLIQLMVYMMNCLLSIYTDRVEARCRK
jgi:hypothetical protein